MGIKFWNPCQHHREHQHAIDEGSSEDSGHDTTRGLSETTCKEQAAFYFAVAGSARPSTGRGRAAFASRDALPSIMSFRLNQIWTLHRGIGRWQCYAFRWSGPQLTVLGRFNVSYSEFPGNVTTVTPITFDSRASGNAIKMVIAHFRRHGHTGPGRHRIECS